MKNFLFGVILAVLMSNFLAGAQTIFKFSGGSVSKLNVTGIISGGFLAPIGNLSFTPLSLSNGNLTLGASEIFTLGYVYVSGSVSPDGIGGLSFKPSWFIGPIGGDGFLQQNGNSIVLNKGVLGLTAGVPTIFGDLAFSAVSPLDQWDPRVGIATDFAFDIAGGAGVVQVN